MKDWIEIFKGGSQVDSSGKTHNGDELIEKAISSFNTEEHEPPVVIGHPKENAPAYGWVSGLKKEMKNGMAVLLAKFKDVIPEFEEMVKKGMFKKRSASFYPDGKLRHVGFLGAVPPAVKGLAEIGFSEDDLIVFEYIEKEKNMEFKDVTGWFMEAFKLGQKSVEPEKKETKPDDNPTNYSEEIEKANQKVREAEEKLQKMKAEFAEKEEKTKQERRREEIKTWVTQKIDEGIIAPKWANEIASFMDALSDDQKIDFSDKSVTPVEWFKSFIESSKKMMEFGEIANKNDANHTEGNASDRLTMMIREKMEKKNMDYISAFTECQKENPEMAIQYMAEIGG